MEVQKLNLFEPIDSFGKHVRFALQCSYNLTVYIFKGISTLYSFLYYLSTLLLLYSIIYLLSSITLYINFYSY